MEFLSASVELHPAKMKKWSTCHTVKLHFKFPLSGSNNTVEENSSIFSLTGMHWLPSARACTNFAPAKSSSSQLEVSKANIG